MSNGAPTYLSPACLWNMKMIYERFCVSDSKLRQTIAVLPWGHTQALMRKFGDDDNANLYYAQEIYSTNSTGVLETTEILSFVIGCVNSNCCA